MTNKWDATHSTTTYSDGDVLSQADLNNTFADIPFVPIGGIIGWAKTFYTKDSGTTDGTTADKLVESGQNFQTTVEVGYVVHNTTDDTFAYVTAVDSDTTLSLDTDIMATAEAYIIYATPALSSNFVECNGQALSDADSPFNGATMPDLNVTQRFLRGSTSSGTTSGSDTHTHVLGNTGTNNTNFMAYDVGGVYLENTSLPAGKTGLDSTTATGSTVPAHMEVVQIMRIK